MKSKNLTKYEALEHFSYLDRWVKISFPNGDGLWTQDAKTILEHIRLKSNEGIDLFNVNGISIYPYFVEQFRNVFGISPGSLKEPKHEIPNDYQYPIEEDYWQCELSKEYYIHNEYRIDEDEYDMYA